jgi:hypothetical protein
MKVLPSFWCKQDFCYSFLMNTAFLFADPNLLHLESEAMINTDDAPSQRSADAIAPFAPKVRENPPKALSVQDSVAAGPEPSQAMAAESESVQLC